MPIVIIGIGFAVFYASYSDFAEKQRGKRLQQLFFVFIPNQMQLCFKYLQILNAAKPKVGMYNVRIQRKKQTRKIILSYHFHEFATSSKTQKAFSAVPEKPTFEPKSNAILIKFLSVVHLFPLIKDHFYVFFYI